MRRCLTGRHRFSLPASAGPTIAACLAARAGLTVAARLPARGDCGLPAGRAGGGTAFIWWERGRCLRHQRLVTAPDIEAQLEVVAHVKAVAVEHMQTRPVVVEAPGRFVEDHRPLLSVRRLPELATCPVVDGLEIQLASMHRDIAQEAGVPAEAVFAHLGPIAAIVGRPHLESLGCEALRGAAGHEKARLLILGGQVDASLELHRICPVVPVLTGPETILDHLLPIGAVARTEEIEAGCIVQVTTHYVQLILVDQPGVQGMALGEPKALIGDLLPPQAVGRPPDLTPGRRIRDARIEFASQEGARILRTIGSDYSDIAGNTQSIDLDLSKRAAVLRDPDLDAGVGVLHGQDEPPVEHHGNGGPVLRISEASLSQLREFCAVGGDPHLHPLATNVHGECV